jgi:hypothetical protein
MLLEINSVEKFLKSLEAPDIKIDNPENILNTALMSPFNQESHYISFNSSCKIFQGEHNGMCTSDTSTILQE